MAATPVSLSSNESYHSDFPSLNGLSLEAQDFDLKQNTADECHCSVEGDRSECVRVVGAG